VNEANPGEPAPSLAPESVRRNTAFAFGVRIAGFVFTGALTIFLVRYLGPAKFGVYSLALSIATLLSLPTDFGVSPSAARFIAERRDSAQGAAAVLRSALRLKLITASVATLVVIALAGPISSAYGASSLEWPLRIVALSLFAQSFLALFMAAFEAIGRNSIAFRVAFFESATETVSSIALVLAGAGVVGAVTGRAVGYGVAVLLGLVLLWRALGRPTARGADDPSLSLRRIATYAGALFVIDVAFSAFTQIDALLIGAFLDPHAVGLFSAPSRMLTVAEYAGLALAGGVAPRLARGRGQSPNVAAFQRGMRILLTLQFMLLAPLVVWAEPITHFLLGSGYAGSAVVLRALAPFAVMAGPGAVLALGVNYLGEARRRMPLALAALATNAVIDVILIPRIGIVAGAIGTDVAYLIFIAGHVVICRSLIDLDLRSLGRTVLRCSAAAGAMSLVLLAIGTSSLSPAQAIIGSILAITTYVAILLLSREFTPAEIASTRGAVAARLRLR
jgi:O-antigen/teichoic acid export membrane protein